MILQVKHFEVELVELFHDLVGGVLNVAEAGIDVGQVALGRGQVISDQVAAPLQSGDKDAQLSRFIVCNSKTIMRALLTITL